MPKIKASFNPFRVASFTYLFTPNFVGVYANSSPSGFTLAA